MRLSQAPPLFENLVGGSTLPPPAKRGGRGGGEPPTKFLLEIMKIGKLKKLVCSLNDKQECVIHIRTLKEALNHGLVLKKVYRVTKFNQRAWLKPYIDMNTVLRKNSKISRFFSTMKQICFKFINQSV